MKKTILLSSILAAGAAFAAVTPTPIEVNSTEVGVIKLAKPTKATLIAVPFLGYEGGDIKVADMINTAELEAGTKLYVPNVSNDGTLTYEVWTLSSEKKWGTPKTIIDINNLGEAKDATGAAANESSVARGGSYWLEPAARPAAGSEENIYLLGRPTSQDGTSTAVGGKWNLVGNASAAAVVLGAATKLDQIAIQQSDGNFRYYTYQGTLGWSYQNDDDGKWNIRQDPSVALGYGLWFKPANTSTIDWAKGTITPVTK